MAGNKSGPKADAFRWSINRAAMEFGADNMTLEKRRRAAGIEPGEDGYYSTRDIASLIFGDKEAETIRKISAEARQVELKNAITEGELIPVASVIKICARILVPVRQKILSSSLSEQERHDMLEDLVALATKDWTKEALDT